MKVLKKTKDWTVFQKRSGRYAVRGADGKYVNADDKLKILADAGIVKAPKKKPAPAPEPEAAQAAEAAEAPAAETEAGEEKSE